MASDERNARNGPRREVGQNEVGVKTLSSLLFPNGKDS